MNNTLETLKTKNENIINNKQKKKKNKKLPEKTNFKVVLLGTYGSGAKTSLINRIMYDKFELSTLVTGGFSYCTKVIDLINGKKIVLDIWDTSFNMIGIPSNKLVLENTDCVVLGFEVISDKSFKEIKDVWYPYAKENTDTDLIYLIGNKIDLINERKVTEKQALNLAIDYNLRYFETSCKENIGIKEFLDDLVVQLSKI